MILQYMSFGIGLLFLGLAVVMGLDLASPANRSSVVILLGLAVFFLGCGWRIRMVKRGRPLGAVERIVAGLLIAAMLVFFGPYILLYVGGLLGLAHGPVPIM